MRWMDGTGAIPPTLIGSHASLIRGPGVPELVAAVSICRLEFARWCWEARALEAVGVTQAKFYGARAGREG